MRLISLNSVPPSGSSVSDDKTQVTVYIPGDRPVAIVVNLISLPRLSAICTSRFAVVREKRGPPSDIEIPMIPPSIRPDLVPHAIVHPTVDTPESKRFATQAVKFDGPHPSFNLKRQLGARFVRLEVDFLRVVGV